jgi:hypothetical protein
MFHNNDLQCGRCGSKADVHSTLNEHSYPHPDDAQNTPENLPFGCSLLCGACLSEYYAVEMKAQFAEDARCKQVAEAHLKSALSVTPNLTSEESEGVYWQAFFEAMYGEVEQDFSALDQNSHGRKS